MPEVCDNALEADEKSGDPLAISEVTVRDWFAAMAMAGLTRIED